MSELNFELLRENIRILIKKNGITQNDLAEIAGMSQSNVSKALNPAEKKQFTMEQVYRIAQHFGLSIDELVGNKAAEAASTSPRAILKFVTKLLSELKLKSTTIKVEEQVFEQIYNSHGYPDCKVVNREITYPAFYFPNHYQVEDFARCEEEEFETYSEFQNGGNDTRLQALNTILDKLLPMTRLYREKEIPEEAFQMILNGYLEQLPEK